MEDIVRVLRVLEYSGPRSAVEKQIKNSIHGEMRYTVRSGNFGEGRRIGEVIIRAATVGTFPEILEQGDQSGSVHSVPRTGASEQPQSSDNNPAEGEGGLNLPSGQHPY